jgi:hypothetical protein
MSDLRPLPTSIPVKPDYLIGLLKATPRAAVSVVDSMGASLVNPGGTLKRTGEGLEKERQLFAQDPSQYVYDTAKNVQRKLADPETGAQLLADLLSVLAAKKLPYLRNSSVDDVVLLTDVAKRGAQGLVEKGEEEEEAEPSWFPQTLEALEKLPSDYKEGWESMIEYSRDDPRVLQAEADRERAKQLVDRLASYFPSKALAGTK